MVLTTTTTHAWKPNDQKLNLANPCGIESEILSENIIIKHEA